MFGYDVAEYPAWPDDEEELTYDLTTKPAHSSPCSTHLASQPRTEVGLVVASEPSRHLVMGFAPHSAFRNDWNWRVASYA